jgi:hypothetical protein
VAEKDTVKKTEAKWAARKADWKAHDARRALTDRKKEQVEIEWLPWGKLEREVRVVEAEAVARKAEDVASKTWDKYEEAVVKSWESAEEREKADREQKEHALFFFFVSTTRNKVIILITVTGTCYFAMPIEAKTLPSSLATPLLSEVLADTPWDMASDTALMKKKEEAAQKVQEANMKKEENARVKAAGEEMKRKVGMRIEHTRMSN